MRLRYVLIWGVWLIIHIANLGFIDKAEQTGTVEAGYEVQLIDSKNLLLKQYKHWSILPLLSRNSKELSLIPQRIALP
ncbi:MAG: hypothetical protein V7K68_17490 [Nostoc sp.]|uniref:hypothetical protein n=1 Tax=Nostoc sp. TaxID=1180 RepID=UPI002FF7D603